MHGGMSMLCRRAVQTCFFFFCQQLGELTTAVKMPETSNKAKGSKSNSSEKIVQLTQRQLEDLIETMVSKATKPLEEKINKLELELD